MTGHKQMLARAMRSSMTPAEETIWRRVRANALDGLHFRRQVVIAGFIVDFYCHQAALAVEIDGPIHDPYSDRERDAILEGRGVATIRFTNEDAFCRTEEVLMQIAQSCRERMARERPTSPP